MTKPEREPSFVILVSGFIRNSGFVIRTFNGGVSMNAKIQAPKSTLHILPADAWRWQAVERIAREVSSLYHFAEIRTPVFEHSELFHRGVGETSDIVHKETYTVEDRGGRSITLRPEGTAGVVRAVIENGLV